MYVLVYKSFYQELSWKKNHQTTSVVRGRRRNAPLTNSSSVCYEDGRAADDSGV